MQVTAGNLLIAVADCTGHGVPGAFMSIVGHNALNNAVKKNGITDPAKILDKVNELVEETFSRSDNNIKDGMDIALCSMELYSDNHEFFSNQKIIEYAGANNSIYIIQNYSLREIRADKQPIGKYTVRKPFTKNILTVQNGDMIYLFSDGYADQFGGSKGKKFKYKQLEDLLISIHKKSMEEQKEILSQTIEDWRGNKGQVDDICILGFRI